MKELTQRKEEVNVWVDLSKRVDDLGTLLDLAGEEEDQSMVEEIRADVERAYAELEKLEFRLMFSGKYDRRDALVSLYAGAGGTESQDWATMLVRMYLRWAEQNGYEAEMLDSTPGEEAGIKSATLAVKGPYAYGYLRGEKGVHRLVRLSPFDSAHRRHTSFALVEVMPDIEDEIEIDIKPDDIRMDVFRAAGAGGQHMQKNATAVRITHLPTGIVASCQNERSQAQNRVMAMKVLRARLFALEEAKQEQQLAEIRGDHITAGWGNQIRSYVLHPYRMVKDLRTGYETGNPDGVLDGALNDFMQAYLESTMADASDRT
jgi:peptide chain release factor 2